MALFFKEQTTWRTIMTRVRLIALTLFFVVPTWAAAQERAFQITGSGVGPTGLPLPGQPPRSHWIIGEATDLGRHTGEGAVNTRDATFQPDGTITGTFNSAIPFVFVAANGDRFAMHYGNKDAGAANWGTFTLYPTETPGVYTAVWWAEFTPVNSASTGRFSNVSGSFFMLAVSEPFVLGSMDPIAYSWSGQGRLTFGR
jgi:hypothetical protein